MCVLINGRRTCTSATIGIKFDGRHAAAAAWPVPLPWAWPYWMRRWACRVWGHVFQDAKAIPPPPGLRGRLGETLQKDTPGNQTKTKKFKKDTPKKTTPKSTL